MSTAASTRELACLAWLAHPGPASDHRPPLGQDCLPVPLWEWTVTRDQAGASAGISHTRRGAIQALTRSLTQAGRPRSGHVRPVLLTEPAHEPACYLRGNPHTTAVFDGKAIQWT